MFYDQWEDYERENPEADELQYKLDNIKIFFKVILAMSFGTLEFDKVQFENALDEICVQFDMPVCESELQLQGKEDEMRKKIVAYIDRYVKSYKEIK